MRAQRRAAGNVWKKWYGKTGEAEVSRFSGAAKNLGQEPWFDLVRVRFPVGKGS